MQMIASTLLALAGASTVLSTPISPSFPLSRRAADIPKTYELSITTYQPYATDGTNRFVATVTNTCNQQSTQCGPVTWNGTQNAQTTYTACADPSMSFALQSYVNLTTFDVLIRQELSSDDASCGTSGVSCTTVLARANVTSATMDTKTCKPLKGCSAYEGNGGYDVATVYETLSG